tara:strand:- start:640 stop:849 length:210 start_codon:yes stop_codon:yes gene_type:complete
MIHLGDIVYQRKSRGALTTPSIIKARLGLVIKEHKEKGAIPQYCVQFNQDIPKWYYQHDLEKIISKEEK